MHKLETRSVTPSAVSLLQIQSSGDASTVVLSTEDAGGFVGEKWQNSIPGKRKQQVTFIGADGQALSLEGVVEDEFAVEIRAAHKVVVEIEVSKGLSVAREAGRVSKAFTALQLVKVVEVWDTPKNCLYRAKDAVPAATAASVDGSGRITRQAAA